MKKLIIHLCIMVSVLGSMAYAASSTSNYVESFWDHNVLQTIEERVVATQENFDEEELIYQLGLVAKYEERMKDDPQSLYVLAKSRKMILLALATMDKEKESILEEVNNQVEQPQEIQEEQEVIASEISSIKKNNTPDTSSIVSSITAKNSNDEKELIDSETDTWNEIIIENETFTQNEDTLTVWLWILDESLPLPIIDSDIIWDSDSESLELWTPNADISYTPWGLYTEFAGSIDWDISWLCTVYYDQIDQIAKRNDFPTSLIIAMRYREHSCIFSNPDNGRWNFQITSHYYEPGEVSRDEFATQVQEFIDFSRAKWVYYDSIQRFGSEPVALSYTSMDINSIRKHAILYNGVYPDVTLESSWYSNENFTQFRGGRDGIVATVLKGIKWAESR